MTSPLEWSLAVEAKADAKRGNITQPENVFSSLTQPLVCFGRAALRKRSLSQFLNQTAAPSDLLFVCSHSLSSSLYFIEIRNHNFTSFVHKSSIFHSMC